MLNKILMNDSHKPQLFNLLQLRFFLSSTTIEEINLYQTKTLKKLKV